MAYFSNTGLVVIVLSCLIVSSSLGWTYYANTGDVIQLQCTLMRDSLCLSYEGDHNQNPTYKVAWVYSPLPPDAEMVTTRAQIFGEVAKAKPPWVPDFPISQPKQLKTGGRYLVFLTVGEPQPEVTLQISNVTWTDAGTYACYCAAEFPPSAISIHQLIVFGRPYVMISAFEWGNHFGYASTRIISEGNLTLTNVTVVPQTNITLTCIYSNTVFPIRKFVWLKDGIDFATSNHDNILQITGMSKRYKGIYACRIVMTDLLNSTGPSFKLDIPEIQQTTEANALTSLNNHDNGEHFPVILVAVLACVLFLIILMTVITILIVRALQGQQRDRVRFTLPNSFNGGYESPR